jgi:hypothetical protein
MEKENMLILLFISGIIVAKEKKMRARIYNKTQNQILSYENLDHVELYDFVIYLSV